MVQKVENRIQGEMKKIKPPNPEILDPLDF